MENLCTLGVKMTPECSWSARKSTVLKTSALRSTPCTPVHSQAFLGQFFQFFLLSVHSLP
jgi:hypothetical protein